MMIRLVLADDHTLFRSGIRALLEGLHTIDVVAEASNGYEALRQINRYYPDVALLDIAMGALNGLSLAALLAKEQPNVRVIILSMHANKEYVLQALRSGAAGYVLKEADTVELELALKAVMRGEIYLSPSISKQVVAGYLQQAGPPESQQPQLSQRQLETLHYIAVGQTTQEIARHMGISVKTVEKHRTQLMDRLHIHDIASLVRYAIRAGLLTSE